MNKYTQNTVIVPWDFSRMSRSALEAAIELVDSPDKIEVVHVTAYPAATEYGVIWGTLTEENICENLKKSFKDELASSDLPELKFTAVFGDPGSQITGIAKDRDASLIVISSHRPHGLESTHDGIGSRTSCPILSLSRVSTSW